MIYIKTALILIDIQNDYFKGGRNELVNPEQALQKTQAILQFFRENEEPIIHIQHVNLNENSTFFIKGSRGCKIHKGVEPAEGEIVFIKHKPNCFFNTDLHENLQKNNITNIVICGMMSHMCIDTSVRAAKNLQYQITVIEDACTTKDLTWKGQNIPSYTVHEVIMASLFNIFAEILTVEDYIKKNSL